MSERKLLGTYRGRFAHVDGTFDSLAEAIAAAEAATTRGNRGLFSGDNYGKEGGGIIYWLGGRYGYVGPSFDPRPGGPGVNPPGNGWTNWGVILDAWADFQARNPSAIALHDFHSHIGPIFANGKVSSPWFAPWNENFSGGDAAARNHPDGRAFRERVLGPMAAGRASLLFTPSRAIKALGPSGIAVTTIREAGPPTKLPNTQVLGDGPGATHDGRPADETSDKSGPTAGADSESRDQARPPETTTSSSSQPKAGQLPTADPLPKERRLPDQSLLEPKYRSTGTGNQGDGSEPDGDDAQFDQSPYDSGDSLEPSEDGGGEGGDGDEGDEGESDERVDPTGDSSGSGDSRPGQFHPNYLTMDARMMLAMADLAWRRGQGPRPPSGGPTDIWQPFKGRTSSAAPEVARSRRRMLEKSAFMDAALLGALGKQGSHGPSDGSDQIPLTRTVGDEAEAEAAANRDDVRRMLWKKHVEPRILTASQRTRRGA